MYSVNRSNARRSPAYWNVKNNVTPFLRSTMLFSWSISAIFCKQWSIHWVNSQKHCFLGTIRVVSQTADPSWPQMTGIDVDEYFYNKRRAHNRLKLSSFGTKAYVGFSSFDIWAIVNITFSRNSVMPSQRRVFFSAVNSAEISLNRSYFATSSGAATSPPFWIYVPYRLLILVSWFRNIRGL